MVAWESALVVKDAKRAAQTMAEPKREIAVRTESNILTRLKELRCVKFIRDTRFLRCRFKDAHTGCQRGQDNDSGGAPWAIVLFAGLRESAADGCAIGCAKRFCIIAIVNRQTKTITGNGGI